MASETRLQIDRTQAVEPLERTQTWERGEPPETHLTRGRTRDPGQRQLVDIIDRVTLRTAEDILGALPALPPEPFSTRELAAVLRCPTLLAQRALYCLREIGIVEPAGRRGRAPLHVVAA